MLTKEEIQTIKREKKNIIRDARRQGKDHRYWLTWNLIEIIERLSKKETK